MEMEASGIGESSKIYLEMILKRMKRMKMLDSGKTSLKISSEKMSQTMKKILKMIQKLLACKIMS